MRVYKVDDILHQKKTKKTEIVFQEEILALNSGLASDQTFSGLMFRFRSVNTINV